MGEMAKRRILARMCAKFSSRGQFVRNGFLVAARGCYNAAFLSVLETQLVPRFLKYLAVSLAPLFLLLRVSLVDAAVVRDLYEAEVPVADHGRQALANASRDALAEVLVKVSGSVEVLQNPVLVEELGRARGHVQQYSYTRDEDAQGDLAARFEFDSSVVTRLLKQAGAPLWTANRPSVLVWVVVQEGGGRQFVNWELAPEVLESLQQGFARRGVPLRIPLLDIQDAAALNADQVWRLQAAPILSASQRYGVEDVLAGRLTALSTGEWVGDWSYLSANDRIDRSMSTATVDEFLGGGITLVAEQMANRYAVAASGAVIGGISLSVTGVNSYNDYARIVAWLEGLELVEHANIESVRGDQIQLRLVAQADAGQLRSTIELNDRLVPLPGIVGEQELNYQWQN